MTPQAANLDPAELAKFDAIAGDWWDPEGPLKTLHEINPLRANYIADRAEIPGARVLDIGCGGGLLSEALAEKGAHVSGVDLAESSIAVARKHAKASGLTIDYRQIDAATLASEEPGSFDIVACLELLEHVPDPSAIVRACSALVRPGGAVFFSTINRNFKSFVFAILGAEHLLRMVPRGTHEYVKLVRPAELAHWCRDTRLDMKELTGLHFNPMTQRYWLGGNTDVNYFAHTRRLPAS